MQNRPDWYKKKVYLANKVRLIGMQHIKSGELLDCNMETMVGNE